MTFSFPTARAALSLGIGLALALPGCGQDTLEESPRVDSYAARTGGLLTDDFDSDEILAIVDPNFDPGTIAIEHGLLLVDELPDGLSTRFRVPAGGVLAQEEAELALDPRVLGVDRNLFVIDTETRQSSMAFDEGNFVEGAVGDQGFLRLLHVARAHDRTRGDGVVVAILDTGIDFSHPALAGHIHPASRDFLDGDTDASESPNGIDDDGDGFIDEALGHGTHVAGLVRLVAPEAKIMVLRVLDADGRGPAWGVAQAIEYAADQGASIINMSLGMLSKPEIMDEALSYAADRGVIMVGSIGNWGAEDPEEYPSSSSSVWAVVATDHEDRAATFTSYSSHAAIAAPGTLIRSAHYGGGSAVWSGTSMASPLVAGTAALLLSIHADWTPAMVLARIQSTARPVTPLHSEQIGELGAGRIDVGAALAADQHDGTANDDGEGEVYWNRRTRR
ncbi:MAG: S8 family serine peptidase [Candidatus Eisenbacteria bacterium]|nr:S8 family serine peptidase [Candidatus Eisenbacteria bacterium]